MQTIYVILGYYGDYDDYEEWIVCATTTEKGAQARIDELQSIIKTLQHNENAIHTHERGDPNYIYLNQDRQTYYKYTEVDLLDTK